MQLKFDVYKSEEAHISAVIRIDDPLTFCEIYNDNRLVSYGVSHCRPDDTFDPRAGAAKAFRSAVNRVNEKTGKLIVPVEAREVFYSALRSAIGNIKRVKVIDNHPLRSVWKKSLPNMIDLIIGKLLPTREELGSALRRQYARTNTVSLEAGTHGMAGKGSGKVERTG